MGRLYNWAVLGCGTVAAKFAADLRLLPHARLYAVASRSSERAQRFASTHGFSKAYGSYEAAATDPGVDIVYIASPNSEHCWQTMMCLENRKAVLCEKAFAINSREVNRMIAAARRNQSFLMEAVWTRFHPSFIRALEIIRSGELGRLRMVRADFGFNAPYDIGSRLYNRSLGGGALLDVGVYPVFAALTALGIPSDIRTVTSLCPTGVDETTVMTFRYPGGETASLIADFTSHSPIQAEYWFENGYMRLNRRFTRPTSITLCRFDEREETIFFSHKAGFGYDAEAAHVMDCLDAGKTESDLMPLALSSDLMEVLDRVREDAGIVFPEHDSP